MKVAVATMEEPSSVSVSDDMFVDGLPVETFTEFDVNMDQVVEIDTEGESTGKIYVYREVTAEQ